MYASPLQVNGAQFWRVERVRKVNYRNLVWFVRSSIVDNSRAIIPHCRGALQC
jgi:hypothetical protein